jgi:hypothetical protein
MPFFELELILFCFSQIPKPIANETEVLTKNEAMSSYFYFFVIFSSFAAVIGIGFVLYFLLRKQSTAKV